MSAALQLLRALRFRLWALTVQARLRRLGGRLVLEVAEVPRFLSPPRLEIDGYPGTLTLRIGRDVKIGRDLVLDVRAGLDGTIDIGDRVTFQNGVRLQPWGGAIRLAADAQVRDRCELKSAGELRVGRRSILGRTTTVHCETAITIGDLCGFAERVTVIDSDHGFDGSGTFFMEQPLRSTAVTLADNVFLATNVVVLRGTTIGANSVAAAGAVLNGGDFPGGHVIAGTPARALKALGGGAGS
ncbi:2,3,4,5-tetrahydropyridine-2,6-dicarboxylate N-acetyltransferase [Paraconexibacter sp. AEG42_29]|uniref:2,3,4,5-tetrahydropyridine-2,6-dicarboxylate N-acetyltransferase n=1 Tax=Paraconexibacter sp. AEG42_29 TaxID=2997339 RepID=A0AAU7AVT2_9ACTN